MTIIARHCPICKDEIPATAHRLKKLCGKKDCMMEQQRISGRKSYHKVLGHTEPEKRSCVVCSADISALRTNRIVCEKPNCKEVIVKRTKAEYYERNNGVPTYEARRRIAAATYRAKHRPRVIRHCQVCRDDISHLAPGAKICLKQTCEDYRNKLRAQKYAAVKPVKKTVLRPAPQPKQPKPTKPVLDKRYQRKPKEGVKPIIRRRPVAKPRITEDDTPWKPRVFNLPEAAPVHTPTVATVVQSSFGDPWSCAACRELFSLCRLHQSMTDGGMKPKPVNQY